MNLYNNSYRLRIWKIKNEIIGCDMKFTEDSNATNNL